MKLKKVCLFLFVVLFFLLLNEISCIANYNQEENFINDEDRRAADYYHKNELESEANKRGLYETSGTHNGHQTYPSGYGEATFTNPGYAYGHQAGGSYYQSPAYSTGQQGSYGLFGLGGHGAQEAHGAFGAPSHGYDHGGHKSLALKGLLIPLAGIALLGAAAALSTNPVLLQLGVVNGRRRRRRSFNSNIHPPNLG